MAMSMRNVGGKNILPSILLKCYLDICGSMFLLFKLPGIQTESSTKVALIQPEAEVWTCYATSCATEVSKSSGFKDFAKTLTLNNLPDRGMEMSVKRPHPK